MITAFEFIDKKRRGLEHTEEELREFITGYVRGDIDESQAAAWLMAVCINGMTFAETSALTMAMTASGETFSEKFDGFTVDKHSTGGIGDKVTLIAGPICAACGIYVPKMSGRGLGYTGGTIDKLESIPGLSAVLDREKFVSVVRKAGIAVAGQTDALVPADKKLYALRSITATVESIPLICSSIMSKKLAVTADGIVLDVKVGDGAFMKDIASAEKLAEAMLAVGKAAGRKCTALLTDMNKPLGHAVGNSVEVIEAIEALKGNSPVDLWDDVLEVSAEMLGTAGYGTPEECKNAVREAVSSGKALERLRKMIELQGGDPRVCDDYSLFAQPAQIREIYAARDGYIGGISCEKTGMYSLVLGAGRKNKKDSVDPAAGIVFDVSVGDKVSKGDRLAVLRGSAGCDIDGIAKEFPGVFTYCDETVMQTKNVMKIIRNC